MARYTDPNKLSVWLFWMSCFNNVAPDICIKLVVTWFSQRFYQICFSNMRGPVKADWVFGGGQVEWISLIGIDAGHSVSVVTHCDVLKLTVCSDLGYSKVTSNELCKAIEKAMRQL